MEYLLELIKKIIGDLEQIHPDSSNVNIVLLQELVKPIFDGVKKITTVDQLKTLKISIPQRTLIPLLEKLGLPSVKPALSTGYTAFAEIVEKAKIPDIETAEYMQILLNELEKAFHSADQDRLENGLQEVAASLVAAEVAKKAGGFAGWLASKATAYSKSSILTKIKDKLKLALMPGENLSSLPNSINSATTYTRLLQETLSFYLLNPLRTKITEELRLLKEKTPESPKQTFSLPSDFESIPLQDSDLAQLNEQNTKLLKEIAEAAKHIDEIFKKIQTTVTACSTMTLREQDITEKLQILEGYVQQADELVTKRLGQEKLQDIEKSTTECLEQIKTISSNITKSSDISVIDRLLLQNLLAKLKLAVPENLQELEQFESFTKRLEQSDTQKGSWLDVLDYVNPYNWYKWLVYGFDSTQTNAQLQKTLETLTTILQTKLKTTQGIIQENTELTAQLKTVKSKVELSKLLQQKIEKQLVELKTLHMQHETTSHTGVAKTDTAVEEKIQEKESAIEFFYQQQFETIEKIGKELATMKQKFDNYKSKFLTAIYKIFKKHTYLDIVSALKEHEKLRQDLVAHPNREHLETIRKETKILETKVEALKSRLHIPASSPPQQPVM